MENDREYIGQREDQLQPIRNYKYQPGDKVKALFVKADRWYDATVNSDEGNNTYSIKFEHLNNSFTQRAEYLRPCLEDGARVLALWFKDGKYLPATIKKQEERIGNYTIQFDSREKDFLGQRPDNIIPLEEFEENEEVLALWGQDGLFYPAQIIAKEMDKQDVISYKIQFQGMTNTFSARAQNLKKLNNK